VSALPLARRLASTKPVFKLLAYGRLYLLLVAHTELPTVETSSSAGCPLSVSGGSSRFFGSARASALCY
jgi:hypothetical protein